MITKKVTDTQRAKPEDKVQVLQRNLFLSSKKNPKRSYGILYDKVYRRDVLQKAWKQVSQNKGKAGVDGKSIEWIKEYGVAEYLEQLQKALKEKRYRPDKVKRTYILKPDGRQRPLGIPTVTDRVVQTAVKTVIEPLFESDFLNNSYGFRPKRTPHQAIKKVEKHIRNGYKWVVDVDLASYFDTIPHEPLMRLVERRVRDIEVLRLIRWWLKAGILEEGEIEYPEQGSPQGGCLSPLLSNIYLHEVDREWSKRTSKIVRFADDMVILTTSKQQAEKECAYLQEVIGKMQLKLNREKTRVTESRDGFDFLGVSFRRGIYKKGNRQREVLIKVPRAKAVKAIQQRIKEAVNDIPLGEKLSMAVKAMNSKLRGWANYFRITNSWLTLKKLVKHTCNQLRLFLRKKYARKKYQYTKRWPDSYFHSKYGLLTVSKLHGRR